MFPPTAGLVRTGTLAPLPTWRLLPPSWPTVRNHPALMSLAPSNMTAASLARRVRAPTPPSLRALLAPKSRERRASVALLRPEPLALLPPRTRRRAAVALRALWSNRFDPRLAAAPPVRPTDEPSVAAVGSCEAPRAPWSCCRATDACLGRRTTSPSPTSRRRETPAVVVAHSPSPSQADRNETPTSLTTNAQAGDYRRCGDRGPASDSVVASSFRRR